jgi:NAD kinase
LIEEHGLQDEKYEVFSEKNKNKIAYIITMGGDGTILWAAK